MSFETNSRGIGDNNAPDYAKQVTEQMARDYAELSNTVSSLLDEARTVPVEITDDEEMGIAAKLIKRLRDTATRIEAFRNKEKEPYLRGGQAVDGFFATLYDKCARKDRKAKPGAADILQARLDDYQQRKLAEEQARRRREAEEAARKEREAREAAEKAAREAEERRLAAERARKPETIEAKSNEAAVKEAEADAALTEAKLAAEHAEETYVNTLARPADMVRTRVDDGPLVTMQQVGYAEVEDSTLLDKELLWPFIKEDAKEAALRQWAKTTGYNKPMAGAAIGFGSRLILSPRLTLIRLALIRNPWSFGGGASRPPCRYSFLHLLFRPSKA